MYANPAGEFFLPVLLARALVTMTYTTIDSRGATLDCQSHHDNDEEGHGRKPTRHHDTPAHPDATPPTAPTTIGATPSPSMDDYHSYPQPQCLQLQWPPSAHQLPQSCCYRPLSTSPALLPTPHHLQPWLCSPSVLISTCSAFFCF